MLVSKVEQDVLTSKRSRTCTSTWHVHEDVVTGIDVTDQHRVYIRLGGSSVKTLLIALLSLVAACTQLDPDPGVTSTARRSSLPAVEDWVPGRVDPATLFPSTVAHLHVALVRAPAGATYGWGITGGRVLWIFRIQGSDTGDFLAEINTAFELRQKVYGLDPTISVAGTVRGGGPVPPTPPGPEFPDGYVRVLVDSAQTHEQETLETLRVLATFDR
jgi:hypothetical protein